MKWIAQKKKTARPFSSTFTLLTSLFLLSPSLAGAYSGGSGTTADPYQIATAQDLIDLGQTREDYGKSFVLTTDIDLAGRIFDRAVIAPDKGQDFGHPRFDGEPFAGRFDGQGHVIRNLCIDKPRVNYQGLFGRLVDTAEISNLGLEGVQISGHTYVGALVGDNDEGTISSSHSIGTVSGVESVGGLVGENDEGTISLSYSTGMVSGESRVGGLVGENSRGSISLSHSTGTVSGENDSVGGLVGDNSRGDISSSYSASTVSGKARVGGLAGRNSGGTISSSCSSGMVSGARQIGGLAGDNSRGTISSSHNSASVYGNVHVGGLAGYIYESGTISWSCSSARVHGKDRVGGLVGSIYKSGTIVSSYSTGMVRGAERFVGGLVGHMGGSATISSSYSSGRVSGNEYVGGLVGYTEDNPNSSKIWSGTISSSFWDMESSEQTQSKGGSALTTEQMQDISTYLGADWDFMDESANGKEDIWWIPESDTPRLWWQYGLAYSPTPIDQTSTGIRELTLQWNPGGPGMQHDVYFGDDEAIVANAGTASQDVFLGRLPADTPGYDLPSLEPSKTYYWRIDGVDDAYPARVWKGSVWCFTITDFVMVKMLDDLESYDDHCKRIFFTWQDGWGHSGGEDIEDCHATPYAGNETGAIVGNVDPPFASHVVVRDASQSLPLYYDNGSWPWFSEAERTWPVPQDWTLDNVDALTLYFRGEAENGRDPLYIATEDRHGGFAVIYHSNWDAVCSTEAQVWHIRLADLDGAGVDVTAIKKLVIGVGHRDNPQPLARGILYVDDIQLTKRGH